jgi:prolyl-tRNA synthetase
MYWSKTLIPTMKEIPDGAEIPSHILMLRAGLVAQVMAGAYTYLPLGLRSLHKAASIVREEMNSVGANELLMSAICPISLFEQTNRVEVFGNVLIKADLLRGNKKIHVAFCPTHEEEVTDLASRFISSYRQLPIVLYQIQTKFRNEERPRFGVLRTSEFLMKDAYSFHTSIDSLGETYQKMYGTYCKIFARCGLPFIAVEAESGPIGGDSSHEFMTLSQHGEDKVVHCEQCGYAANMEKAEIGSQSCDFAQKNVQLKEIAEVDTPAIHTVDQVCEFLSVKPKKLIKTLIYVADGNPVAVLIRGDHEANEYKIKRQLEIDKLELASAAVVERVTGAPVGFAGPIRMIEKIPIHADSCVMEIYNAIVGANRADKHLVNVNTMRDFMPERIGDFRNAVSGDACPRCSAILAVRSAIEVGHVFKLGTKYAEQLNAKFLDADESQKTIIMGCYGIGINRIIAGVVESSHDDAGIIWPVSVAPFEAVICPMKVADGATMQLANSLHDKLWESGVDCIVDDRDQRAGVKFKDADLIGFPLRIVIGDKGLAEGKIEVKWRWDKETTMLPIENAAEQIINLIKTERITNDKFTTLSQQNKTGKF